MDRSSSLVQVPGARAQGLPDRRPAVIPRSAHGTLMPGTIPKGDRGSGRPPAGSRGPGRGRRSERGPRRLFGPTGAAAALIALFFLAIGVAHAAQTAASGCCCPPLRRTRTVTVTRTAGAGLVARDADRAEVAGGAVRRDECPRCPPSATILAAAAPGEDAAACCPLLPAETVTETRTIVVTTRVRLAANNVAPTVTVVRTVTATVTAPCPAFDPIVACQCLTSTRSATATPKTTSGSKWTTSSSRSRTPSATSKTTSRTRSASPATSTRSNTNSLAKTGTRTTSSTSATSTRLGTYCATPNAAIADKSTVTSDIVVPPGIGLVSDVDVQVFWNHTYPYDVTGALARVADGRNITLFGQVSACGEFRSYSTRFDDSAPGPFTCDPAATARPAEALSAFRGLPAGGTWRLSLSDWLWVYEGTLSSWCIFVDLVSATTSPTGSTTATKTRTPSSAAPARSSTRTIPPTSSTSGKPTSLLKTSARSTFKTSTTAPRLETFCATPRATIPDLGTALSEIWVPFGLGAISDVDVQVFWNHTYPGDVAGELTRLAPSFSPGVFDSQVKIALFDRLCESCVSFRTYSTRFDDSAPDTFTCDPTATVRPAQSLSTFRGLTAGAAYWRLNLSDFESPDAGILSSWCIYFDLGPAAGSTTRMAGSSVAVGTVATPTFTRSRTTSVTRTGSRTASMQSKTAPRLETFCATPRATIPDLGTALSEIWVPFGLGAISDVDVQVFWNHTYPGDVAGELTRLAPSFSPGVFDSQVKIALFDRLRESCVSLRTYSTRFDDSAPAPFTCNPAATARPAQSLSTFRGLTAVAAYWRLNLSDFEISDTGTLSSWCIYFEIPPSATSRTRSTTSAISGTSSATAKTTSSRTRTRSLTRTATATPHPFSIIRRLDSSAYDPSALTLGHDGLLYGTLSGGAPVYLGSGAYGFGSIFRLDRWGGSFARFAYFGSYNGAGSPVLDKSKAGLLHVGNGTFFGRTLSGSANNGGTLYRFRADAGAIEAVQPMWPFDGTYPPLVRARNGDIFGVSGRDQSTSDERGFVYRLSVAGVFSNLGFNLNYDASTAGNPIWVVQGCSGDDSLYGLTKSDRSIMLLFRLTPSGVFSVLHEFRDNPYNGFWPYSDGGIVSGPDCALYGTGIWRIFQYGDGSYEFLNEVVVWKYDIGSGHVSKVAIIATNVQAASVPVQLTVGWDGALYGVSQIGGANNGGFLFRVTTAGSVTILHNFRKDEAWEPRVALMQGPGGVLYGAAARYMADIALSSGTVVRQEVEWGAIFSYNLSVAGFSPP